MQPKPTTPAAPAPAGQRPRLSPDRIMQMAWGYASPLIIEAAVRLRVFDLLDGGPETAEQAAQPSNSSVRGMRTLLDALVGLELLSKDAQGRYALTPESAEFLVSTKPTYFGGFIAHTSTQLIPKWMRLTEVVRTGQPVHAVNQENTGSAFFQQFVEDLFPMNFRSAQILGEALGVGQATQPVKVLDLAAGSGVWGIGVATQSPQVRVTAVDWPGVLEVTKRVAAKHGMADRFQYVEGDLRTAPFGFDYQIATLGHILHSEGEARSRDLLKRTFAALAPGGHIAIAEFLVNEERTGPAQGLIFGVNMLVNTDHGDVFSFGQLRRWLEETGFTNVRELEIPGPSPLVLATKPAK